jgi:glycyl-tRNA synthetase
MKAKQNQMEKLVAFLKDNGFINLSSEPYGGFSSSYDYGPYGVEIKNNLKKAWWDTMTKEFDNIVGIDSSILMSPKVWEASGHLTAGFADELVECKECHKRFKADELENDKCPSCKGELGAPKKFNVMMKTFVGPIEDSANVVYLRGEACQGIYMNFLWAKNSARMKIPFGICQIGKAFRNEITPGPFTFRTREFEQMDLQFFVHPSEADKYFEFWKEQRMNYYIKLGISKDHLRFADHPQDKLAHYAKKACDIEYLFPFGWSEIEGIHNRTDWDLGNHSKASGTDLSYFDQETKEKYMPYIIETSAGCDRTLLAFLSEAFVEFEKGRNNDSESMEYLMNFDKKLAPVKLAIMPLMKNKEELQTKAREIYDSLKFEFNTKFDDSGSIGKRYRRMDELGTLYCITIDFDTLTDNCVTIRSRDTMKQERIQITELKNYLREKYAY